MKWAFSGHRGGPVVKIFGVHNVIIMCSVWFQHLTCVACHSPFLFPFVSGCLSTVQWKGKNRPRYCKYCREKGFVDSFWHNSVSVKIILKNAQQFYPNIKGLNCLFHSLKYIHTFSIYSISAFNQLFCCLLLLFVISSV